MRTLFPCAARKFASQGGRNQQRPRPTIRRRLIAKAVPPPTERAPKTSPTPTSTSQPAIGAPELSLLLTAALWGSYAPALRFLF